MKFDLVISGGQVITSSLSEVIDIGILDGKIAEIGHGLIGETKITCPGKILIPGGIDPHVHLEMPTPNAISSDDWLTGTRAAACGGTTTVIDFVEPAPEETLLEALKKRRAQADAKTVIDFSLHMTIDRVDEKTLSEIPEVVKNGVPSFKCYTTYAMRLEDDQLLQAIEAVSQAGGIVIVHAENHAIIASLRQKFISTGKTSPFYHPLSRPVAAESEAIERVLSLAESVSAPIYFVHVSSHRGAQAIQRAQSRNQIALGETCPQYLVLTSEEYSKPGFEGAKFICSPPLRSADNQQGLWEALKAGTMASIGTDHCPFFFKGMKDLGRGEGSYPPFTDVPGGMPGIESRLALIYTYGVRRGLLTENQWVSLCSTGPAQIFGLYPQKGEIAVGSDADLVVFDPHRQVTLSSSILHENVDYTPYEGFQLKGFPEMTLLHGKIIAEKGVFLGGAQARFIPRKPFKSHRQE